MCRIIGSLDFIKGLYNKSILINQVCRPYDPHTDLPVILLFLQDIVGLDGTDYKVTVSFASDYLKRQTDSVKCAMENDIFGSLPDDSLLDDLEVIEP